MKKSVFALIMAIVMLFSLVACGPAKPVETQPQENKPAETQPQSQSATKPISQGEDLTFKKNISIAHHQANVAIGPQDTGSGMQKLLGFLQFNSLTIFDQEAKKVVGRLAESFSAEEGGKVWTFVLKQGIKFHNGEELEADDVLYTYERAMEKGKNTSKWTKFIEAIEIVDKYTVRFVLNAPNMDFGFTMTDYCASILNREANEADPENGYGIGTGAWKLKEFIPNDHAVYERFDDCFLWDEIGSMNPTETITVYYMADQNTRMIGVQAGDLDIGCIANNGEFYNYQQMDGVEPVIAASWSLDYVGMNPNCEYFQDENVRKAVAYAIDKDEALEVINNGFGLTCKSFWCPDTIGYTENFSENYSFNLEKAKEYLAKSAYPNGFTVTLTTINAYSLYAETVQAQLARIGINCEVNLTDSPGMSTAGKDGSLQIYIWNSTISPYGDYLTQTITSTGSGNYAHFTNEKIDELMAAAVSEPDEAKRAEMYQQVQEELNNDCYLVPMFFGYLSNLTRDNVEGYMFTSEGYYLWNVRAVEEG